MSKTVTLPTYRKIRCCAYLALGLLAMQTVGAQNAGAQSVPSASPTAQAAASVRAYWTPDRMKSAVSLDSVVTGPTIPGTQIVPEREVGSPQRSPGSPPTDVKGSLFEQLYIPDESTGLAAAAAPADYVTPGYYFTTSRVIGNPKKYPYRASGKLFFSDTVHGGNFVCSAATIKYRIVVTAGHCVAHGSTDGATRHFYNNFLYVPAYYDGSASFGSWPWAWAWTTNNWYLSGSVPNVQDVGMIEVQDVVLSGVLKKLGNRTGWLGWWTQWGRQYPNNHTQLGYPVNLDSGQRMQINNAQGVQIVSNNVEAGSLMSGGSSGGPWIQDFGEAMVGASAYTGGNWVLGTTSYEYVPGASHRRMGASIFQNAGYPGHGFGDLWNAACARRVGNC